ncbi:hypothetical protein GUI26_24230 [Escherichia coli]|nr:hypothetical protein [Escherichia coli]
MSEKVVFSQLSRKFIDENDATPAEAQQVVYYSLAIGHHLGVIDCLEAAGYRYGRQIADDFLTQLGQGEEQVARWLEAENDPRLNEIVSHLNHVVEEARIR